MELNFVEQSQQVDSKGLAVPTFLLLPYFFFPSSPSLHKDEESFRLKTYELIKNEASIFGICWHSSV
jgi:hypothetical protein